MQPIAAYSEVRFEGGRTFALFPDRIVVRGKQFLKSDFETSIALKSLDPNPDTLRLRSQSFTMGMCMAGAGFIGCSVLLSGFHLTFAALAPVMLASVGMAGLMLAFATFRKVEFVRFKNDGAVVILDIARAGKNAAQLDSFVDALTKQIKETRGAA